MLYKLLLSLTCMLNSAGVLAQAEIRLAYHADRPDALPASYAHDSLIKSISVVPLVTSNELIAASVGFANGDGFLKIQVSEPARAKINEIALANASALKSRASDDIVDLAIMLDGKILAVINGAVHPLDETTINIWGSGGDDAEKVRSWQAIAEAITRPKKSAIILRSEADSQH